MIFLIEWKCTRLIRYDYSIDWKNIFVSFKTRILDIWFRPMIFLFKKYLIIIAL